MNAEAVTHCLNACRRQGCDALLVAHAPNIRYLTGYTQGNGILCLMHTRKPIFFTSALYEQEACAHAGWQVVVVVKDCMREVCALLRARGVSRLGFESEHVTYTQWVGLRRAAYAHSISLKKMTRVVESRRRIKTHFEISCIRAALQTTQAAYRHIRARAQKGVTELSLALETESLIRISPHSSLSFAPIIAAGKNSSQPHHQPSGAANIKNFLLADIGAAYKGYCADLTRVFYSGRMPKSFEKILSYVRGAHDAAVHAVRDGVRACDVDAAARNYLAAKHVSTYFTHGTGHGVGLEVHEAPFLNKTSTEILTEGMVVTIEPGVYIPGKFGVRLENMVVVGQSKGELLSGFIYW